jgi:hypothetical protein
MKKIEENMAFLIILYYFFSIKQKLHKKVYFPMYNTLVTILIPKQVHSSSFSRNLVGRNNGNGVISRRARVWRVRERERVVIV